MGPIILPLDALPLKRKHEAGEHEHRDNEHDKDQAELLHHRIKIISKQSFGQRTPELTCPTLDADTDLVSLVDGVAETLKADKVTDHFKYP